MRHRLVYAAALAVAVGLGAWTLAGPGEAPASGEARESERRAVAPAAARGAARPQARRRAEKLARGSRYLIARIDRHRLEAWRWQRLMSRPLSPSSGTVRRTRSPEYREWVLALWRNRAARARRQAQNPPRKAAWLCLQRHEGAWNDPGAPYYGGLQMDLQFQRTYGPELLRRKGTADNWTPVEQMWVAERAYRSGRGFTPWPNTARMCGLL